MSSCPNCGFVTYTPGFCDFDTVECYRCNAIIDNNLPTKREDQNWVILDEEDVVGWVATQQEAIVLCQKNGSTFEEQK